MKNQGNRLKKIDQELSQDNRLEKGHWLDGFAEKLAEANREARRRMKAGLPVHHDNTDPQESRRKLIEKMRQAGIRKD